MSEINKKELGAFIAAQRKAKGYTQKQLAAQLFISDKAVSKWETGASIPDAGLWIPLSELLGVSVTELLLARPMEQPAPMNAAQVESLVQKALRFSEDDPARRQRAKRRQAVLFGLCVLLSGLENLILYRLGAVDDQLLLFELLGLIFGAYFALLARERLPAYYDENRITHYSDGILHLNVPGLALNNSNWPLILRVGRLWSMGVLVGYPLLYGAVHRFLPAFGPMRLLTLSLLLVLGGLFAPMYYFGKKYQ